MENLAQAMAERFYETYERILFLRVTYSKTSLQSKLWRDLPERNRSEYVEAFRQLLADPKLLSIIKNRGDL